jgi:uncharacterized membrane protein YccC
VPAGIPAGTYALLMPHLTVAVPAASRFRVRLPRPAPGTSGQPWMPRWSMPAALRALRATLVIPGLFALTFKVIGNPQMALFATFGGFATLVLASFGGTRRDKAVAHAGLAIAGSALIAIGTAVSGTTWLAVVVTVPVAFVVFFAGVAGPNCASGVTAALLAYVLPVASSGTAGTIPARLAGWWLASALSTAAVLLLSPKSPGDRLRTAAAALAALLADNLEAALSGRMTGADVDASAAAKHQLMNMFAATPYRPTGLATADQGLASVVQLLEWCTALIGDTLDGHMDVHKAAPADHELLATAAGLLEDVSWMLGGQDVSADDVLRDLRRLERAREASVRGCWPEDTTHGRRASPEDTGSPRNCWSADSAGDERSVTIAAHADAIAVAVRSAAADAMVASQRADPATVAAQRRSWASGQADSQPPAEGKLAALAGALGVAATHASLRSVWFRNSARGAVALAAAVAVADLINVQHAFWVVLGTLSVLRSNASGTGSTALRALAGTALGFAVGAAVLLGIGTGQSALWIALPIAVLVAAYAPGAAPFTVGQAAFTITVVVLFNLLVPAGWTVGLLRIEDVAIGCGVSIVVGILFWPRGAGSVVGDDLADAFRRGAAYLTQAVDWSLGLSRQPPGAAQAAAQAGIRLDDAIRGFLAEQGAKRLSKPDLWRLVMAATRLRLTAYSVVSMRWPDGTPGGTESTSDASGYSDDAAVELRRLTAELAGFYDGIAAEVGPPHRNSAPEPVAVPVLADGQAAGTQAGRADGADPAGLSAARALWIGEHLSHLTAHAHEITLPAEHLAQQRRIPWWR